MALIQRGPYGAKKEGVIGIDAGGNIGFLDEVAEKLTGFSSREAMGKPLTHILNISGYLSEDTYNLPHVLKGLEESGRPIPNRSLRVKNCSPAGETGRASGFLVTICDNDRVNEPPMKVDADWPAILMNSLDDDFNDIITVVLGNISLAKLHAKRGDKILEKLEEAEKACLRARTLVRRLFALANIGMPRKQTANVSDLIKNSVATVLRDSGISFSARTSDDLWPARIDPSQIVQAITTLILDWTDAAPPGGAIRITAENTNLGPEGDNCCVPLRPGNYVKVEISLRESPESRKTEGISSAGWPVKKRKAGLGFAVAHLIIKKHEGHVEYIERTEMKPEFGIADKYHIYIPAVLPALTENPTTETQRTQRDTAAI
ncbi:MAG: hypothetical protein V1736_09055 [Pseudomonadota bacterium]